MRHFTSVTLSAAALSLLRPACYGLLQHYTEELDQTFESRRPESSQDTWDVFARLAHVGRLLDLVGWTDQDCPVHVELTGNQIAVAIRALRDQSRVESGIATAALCDHAAEQAERATSRQLAINDVLSFLDAAARHREEQTSAAAQHTAH